MSENSNEEIKELLKSLPKEKHWKIGSYVYLINGFWCPDYLIRPLISFQRNLCLRDTDIIVAASPKSGTTWLIALTFTIVNRSKYSPSQSPLLTTNPHDLVPSLEFHLLNDDLLMENFDKISFETPRIFYTHIPFKAHPRSVHDSKCKILHICRNPLDQFTSFRHFLNKNFPGKSIPVEEIFDLFCNGTHSFGPFWDHVLDFWKASKENPQKVMSFKYEDMKRDIKFHVRKLADFLGFPFTEEEENQGVVEDVIRLCSFENLKSFEVNKTGNRKSGVRNSSFFRKGEVGDWTDFLSPSMALRLQNVMNEKLQGSGMSFENFSISEA